MAAAIIPLLAMIGSGVDVTRAYMAQNRFSQACDAGSLAGRKLLAGTTVSQAVRDEATRFFRFNFPKGEFETADYTLTITAPTPGTLQISSSTTIPTTIMKMFGYNTLPISATCSATQDFINTDIVFVFDLSGSMNCPVNRPNDACGNVNQSDSKLNALKDAAKALYATLEPAQTQLAANNLRMRYGFVNYSSAVNVGAAVYAKNPDNLVTTWTYQSRVPARDDSSKNAAWCDANDGVMMSIPQQTWWGYYYVTACRYPVSYNTGTWLWRPVQHDVRAYLAGNTPFLASRNAFSTRWAGCIEERGTDNVSINGGSNSFAPNSAFDLSVSLPATNDATRWRPAWPDTEFDRGSDSPTNQFFCPTAARRLQNYHNNKAGFDSYVNGLNAIGGTYHDIGMIWGARFVSSKGVFAANPAETNDVSIADNPEKIRGFGVKRYLIFMTDGDMSPNMDLYSPYGIEKLDRRVTGGSNNQLDRHLQRFRMACNAAKASAIDVWVIAFATSLTTDMQECASKPEQAAGINDRATLIAKFQEIGSKIGSLRLSR